MCDIDDVLLNRRRNDVRCLRRPFSRALYVMTALRQG